jgi:hypothetical protein
VASPILANIYLHKLDVFCRDGPDSGIHHPLTESEGRAQAVPDTRGERRVRNPAYQKAMKALIQARKRGDRTQRDRSNLR